MLSKSSIVLLTILTILSTATTLKHFRFGAKSRMSLLSKSTSEVKKNICTSGKNPSWLSIKEYLDEFAKGPCSPIAAVPGYSASRVIVEITDCELLQKERPETFKVCGWTKCGGGRGSPQSEYRGWIPGMRSPLAIFTKNPLNKECYGALLGVEVGKNKAGKKAFVGHPGVKVVAFGESPNTRSYKNSKCAAEGFLDNIPIPQFYFNKELERAGYRNGLTMQFMPYDWRIDTSHNTLTEKYGAILNDLYDITGKKITLIAHSMGNIVSLNYLWDTKQAEKDRLIEKYIMVTSPVLGNSQFAGSPFGAIINYFFPLDVAKELEVRYPSDAQLCPRATFKVSKGTPWMKAIHQRIKDEASGKDIKRDNFFSIFPPISEKCLTDLKGVEDTCKLGLRDFWNFGNILGKDVNPGNLIKMYKKYSFSKSAPLWKEYINDKQNHRINTLVNPGVPIASIFYNHVPTVSHFTYKKNPLDSTLKGKPATPEWEKSPGDSTIVTTSSILPALKWMYDWKNKADKNAKPVHLIHGCGSYDRRANIGEVEKNEFYSMECDCRTNKRDPSKCDHVQVLRDSHFINLAVNTAINGKTGKVGGRFAKMSESDIKTWWMSCKLYNR